VAGKYKLSFIAWAMPSDINAEHCYLLGIGATHRSRERLFVLCAPCDWAEDYGCKFCRQLETFLNVRANGRLLWNNVDRALLAIH